VVCAHGGDTQDAPANTEDAFTRALHERVDCVEVDVARTKDDVLVVLHARELSELLGGRQGVQVRVEVASLVPCWC
jgi:glycerophosphoryl diester phosphodiesterase